MLRVLKRSEGIVDGASEYYTHHGTTMVFGVRSRGVAWAGSIGWVSLMPSTGTAAVVQQRCKWF